MINAEAQTVGVGRQCPQFSSCGRSLTEPQTGTVWRPAGQVALRGHAGPSWKDRPSLKLWLVSDRATNGHGRRPATAGNLGGLLSNGDLSDADGLTIAGIHLPRLERLQPVAAGAENVGSGRRVGGER